MAPELNSHDHKIYGVVQQCQCELQVSYIEEIMQVELWREINTAASSETTKFPGFVFSPGSSEALLIDEVEK